MQSSFRAETWRFLTPWRSRSRDGIARIRPKEQSICPQSCSRSCARARGSLCTTRKVKRIANRNFERVNQTDFDALLKDCVPNVYHRFGGHHALGGERHDREALRRWFERLGRLGRNLRITVNDVWVKGLPHNTVAIIRWSATANFPEGSRGKWAFCGRPKRN